MSQTNWIGAFIAIGFIAYVIANNQLQGYLQVLGIVNDITTQQRETTQSNEINALNSAMTSGGVL